MNSKNKKVGIIGAGPTGLSACKSALEYDLIPTCFDKNNHVGGAWCPKGSRDSKMWDEMRTNVSKYSMSFSDYQYNDKLCNGHELKSRDEIYPRYYQIYNYLYNYAIQFNLLQYVKLNSNVIKVIDLNSNGTANSTGYNWEIVWKNEENGEIMKEQFEFLIVATGIFQKNIPCSLVGKELKEFTGNVIYGSDYKNNEIYKEKKVVVLGTSLSGNEISAEISFVSSACINVGHENQLIINKFIPSSQGPLLPWELVFFKRSSSINSFRVKSLSEIYDTKKKLIKLCAPKQDKSINPNPILPVKDEIPNKPGVGLSISQTYYDQVENGSIKVYAGNNYSISSSSGHSVTFSNDKGDSVTVDNVDTVILCNGYQIDLSFLDNDILSDIGYKPNDALQPLILYKNIFAPNYKNIAFASLYRDPYFVECELFSRWSCSVFSGHTSYPSKSDIATDIEYQLQLRNNYPRPQFPIPDIISHCDWIANQIGVYPNLEQMKIDNPSLYNDIMDGLYCSAAYRLVGIGSNAKLATQIITNYSNDNKTLVLNKFCNN